MKLALILLGSVSLIELSIWLRPFWGKRKIIAGFCLLSLSILSGYIYGSRPSVWAFLLLFFSVYRVINLLRLVEGRSQADILYHVARKSSLILIGSQLVVLATAWAVHHYSISNAFLLIVTSALQLLAALIVFSSTLRHIVKARQKVISKAYVLRDLPSLSVAIPARNETTDLEECLASLVMSNYPKLEILVLDDCSQNKRTPEIIRSYAQAGIRFIEGQTTPDSWLAKNYAYEQLYDQASGDLILFCGVDARFSEGSLRAMVEYLLSKKKSMLSVMPVNLKPSKFSLAKLLLQPSRYAWELALPRRILNRPPVLSTCWLISAVALKNYGGFKAVRRSIVPESYFAHQAVSDNDSYSFIQGSTSVNLKSLKSVGEQRATTLRTRYPQLHRRPELVALTSLSEALVLLMPAVIFILSLSEHNLASATLSLIAFTLITLNHSILVGLTFNKFLIRGLLILPLAVINDIVLLNYSMWMYEFREVIWKGRNVCLPVMRIITDQTKV